MSGGGSKSAEAGAQLSRETLEAVCRREPDALAVMISGDRPSKIVDIEPHHAEDLIKFLERNAGVFPSH